MHNIIFYIIKKGKYDAHTKLSYHVGMKKYDILLMGDIAGVDVTLTDQLSEEGFHCCIMKKRNKLQRSNNYNHNNKHFDVVVSKNILHDLKLIYSTKLIVSFTGRIIRMSWGMVFLKGIIKMPPIINFFTGSDISELIKEKSMSGLLYRWHLKKCDINWCTAYPNIIKNLLKYKIKNLVFIPFPHRKKVNLNGKANNISDYNNEIVFFHPSNLDWGLTDNNPNRNSTKGNDRFIRAYIRAIHSGLKAKCIILNRGSDKEEAKELIKRLEADEYFVWKDNMSQDEFMKELQQVDVVVDQFDIGGFGGIALESMAIGKPVITYIQESCSNVMYQEKITVLNAHSEEEIYQILLKCRDRDFLRDTGNKSKSWVENNLRWKEQFALYYTILTGDIKKDYGF